MERGRMQGWVLRTVVGALLGGGVSAAPAAPSPVLEPVYHRMPLALEPPAPSPLQGAAALRAQAQQMPAAVLTPAVYDGLSTRGLTDAAVRSWLLRAPPQRAGAARRSVVYNPGQLRAAYELGADAAGGAGQTVVIVDAYDHPNALADLNAFSRRFGLPECRNAQARSVDTLPPAAATCSFSVLYTDSRGQPSPTPPRYDDSWATEIALDTQWAHAIAPQARIVLIEAGDAYLDTVLGAIALANRVGASPLSMSFGAAEDPELLGPRYTTEAFGTPGMSYLAASGDSGSSVPWPAVVPSVISVGGTTLDYRSRRIDETVWPGSGGGISAWTARPPYQQQLQLPHEADGQRVLNDVALDADPNTGVYVAFSGRDPEADPRWYAVGGTSLSSPVWAGVIALANARRAQAGLGPLGQAHPRLYDQLGPHQRDVLFNIVDGSNGDCPVCKAGPGYNGPTGVGTPRITPLLDALAGGR